MKKCVIIMFIVFSRPAVYAQSEEAEQLLLNVVKLTQLKEILSNMYKGYEVISKGYTTVKNISQGNFNLHQVFIDNLMKVSPVVKNYKKTADIISYQLRIVSEYKKAFRRFKADDNFTQEELAYIGKVYSNLFNQSLKNLDALITISTADKLRMSDDERLKAIDNLFNDMQEKLSFLRYFNNSATVLAVQRAKEKNNITTAKNLYGITP